MLRNGNLFVFHFVAFILTSLLFFAASALAESRSSAQSTCLNVVHCENSRDVFPLD